MKKLLLVLFAFSLVLASCTDTTTEDVKLLENQTQSIDKGNDTHPGGGGDDDEDNNDLT